MARTDKGALALLRIRPDLLVIVKRTIAGAEEDGGENGEALELAESLLSRCFDAIRARFDFKLEAGDGEPSGYERLWKYLESERVGSQRE